MVFQADILWPNCCLLVGIECLFYVHQTNSSTFWFVIFGLLQLSEIVKQGQLVSDEIIIRLLSKRLVAGEAKGDLGFILDGFPYNPINKLQLQDYALQFLKRIQECL